MRNTYLKEVYNLAAKDRNVLSLVADNGMIVYDDFRRDFPEQYFNFGISEGHMITAAAGMASCGKIPFAYTIGAFLAYRSFEFIRLDVCLQKMNVKIVGIGAGMSYGTYTSYDGGYSCSQNSAKPDIIVSGIGKGNEGVGQLCVRTQWSGIHSFGK